MHSSSREGPPEKRGFGRNAARAGGAVALSLGILAGPLAIAAQASVAPHQTTAAAVPSIYVPLSTPVRVEDTRTGSGLPGAGDAITAGGKLHVLVAGTGALDAVPATATAVVANVTAVTPTAAGYFSVYPTGSEPSPLTSNLNFKAGENDANLVTVTIGTGGDITIFNHAGTANALVDVYGYYTSTPTTPPSGLYTPVSPYRALGTLDVGASVGPASNTAVTVTGGSTGVPADATAVVVNVTVAHATAASFVTAYGAPALTAEPTFSTVNFTPGPQVVANRATVPVGTNGDIEIYNHAGTADVDVDIDGYYSGTGAQFVALATPYRVTDTRLPTNGTPIAATTTETFDLSPTGSPVPATASAVAANFTVVSGDAAGYATIYPISDTTNPLASDINWMANEAVPNFTIADTAGTGKVDVFASHGAAVNLVIDEFGYFTSVPVVTVPSVAASNIVVTSPATTSQVGTPITDNGATETITATVYHGTTSGPTVAGDGVLFSVATTDGSSGTCGTVSPTTAITNGSGVATTTYTAPSSPTGASSSCTVTARDAFYGETGSETIAQSAVPNSVALSASATSIPAGSTGTITYTATVTPGYSGSADNNIVDFTASGSPADACGAITPTNGETNTGASNTPVTVTVAAGAASGFCTVTATDVGTVQVTPPSGPSASVTTDTTASVAIAKPTVSFSPTSASLAVGGSQAFTVTVMSPNGLPVAGDYVNFTTTSSAPGTGICGSVTPSLDPTNSSGQVTVTYATTSSNVPGTCTITAQEAGAAATGSAAVTETAVAPAATINGPSDVALGTAVAYSMSVTNDTSTTGTDTATFSVSGTGCGTFAAATEPITLTNGAGTSSVDAYTASAANVFCTISVSTVDGGSASMQIGQGIAVVANTVAVAGTNATPLAATTGSQTITATVTNGSGGSVSGDAITWTVSGGTDAGDCAVTPTSSATGTSGQATTLLSYFDTTTSGDTCIVTGTDPSGGSGSYTVTFTAPALTATAPTSETAGTSANWTLTATPSTFSGTDSVTVSGDDASPNGTTPTVPTTVTFTDGVATVPVTLVDAAAQTLEFAVDGATSTGDTAVTPSAAAVATAYISHAATEACGSATFTATALTQGAAPTDSATQTDTGSAATGSVCTLTVTLDALDAYGNAATGSGTVATASGSSAHFTVPSSATITGGTGTLAIDVVTAAGFSSTALTIGSSTPYNVVASLSD